MMYLYCLNDRLDTEEQRQSLGCCDKEDTCANDHHYLLFDILLLVVHGDVNRDRTDHSNNASDGITELHDERHVLGNLLRDGCQSISAGSVITSGILGIGGNGATEEHQSKRLNSLGSKQIFRNCFDFLHLLSFDLLNLLLHTIISPAGLDVFVILNLLYLYYVISEEGREQDGGTYHEKACADKHHDGLGYISFACIHLYIYL